MEFEGLELVRGQGNAHRREVVLYFSPEPIIGRLKLANIVETIISIKKCTHYSRDERIRLHLGKMIKYKLRRKPK
jgi:hypothetical protein